MPFGLNIRLPDDLTRIEDEARDWLRDLEQDGRDDFSQVSSSLATLEDRLRPSLEEARSWFEDRLGEAEAAADDTVFRTDALETLLDRSGLAGLGGDLEIRNLDDLARLTDRLPSDLAGPDDTGEVPTGSAEVPRGLAALGATLSAAPRIIEALGPTAQTLTTRGETYTVVETYRDPDTGFSALRLYRDGGAEVFAIDGLQVGSRADEVTAATLGQLQVGSDAFAEMVADAAAVGLAGDGPVLFVGPSLGGAIAQAAAYETAEALLAAPQDFDTGAVQLVTVDPLGGRDATEWLNDGMLDPEALELITALNLRTEGDIVSRIGSHIGATLTLPALDEDGNRVELDAGEAHANVVSLLQALGDDAPFAAGTMGAPEEISGFARASELGSPALIAGWEEVGSPEASPRELQMPGEARLSEDRTVWMLDTDSNGSVDYSVQLSEPLSPARADLVL
ncbi:MAG TPA: hypothetical protein VGN83_20830 [Falsiroseomonas sp.]|jgi:hypothetical protein|nr:hypothetical protein [Falsiroseomonas sp.]